MLKIAGIAGAGALMPKPLHAFSEFVESILHAGKSPKVDEWAPKANPDFQFGMVIDLGLCIGCRRCSLACKLENNVPDFISPPYIAVFERDTASIGKAFEIPSEKIEHVDGLRYTKLRKDKTYMPVQCNHCDRAPCVRVCPTGASFKDIDGIVMIDYSKCIGCRYCMQACPYNARRFNWYKPEIEPERVNPLVPIRPHGVVEKCTFCVHRTRRGRTTRCVEACPNKARTFGNLKDPNSEVSKLVANEKGFRIKERMNTGPRIYYLTKPKRKPMRWYKPLPPPENIRGIH